MQAARKTPRIQKKAEMAQERQEEVMVQGRREEVIPHERQGIARRRLEMARGRQEMAQERQGIARRRLEMARGRLAGCRRELPERMLTQRRQTDSRRKKMATCRAMQHRTEQEVTVEEHRAEMAA